MSKSMPPMDLSKSISTSSKLKPSPPAEKVEDKLPARRAKSVIPSSSTALQTCVKDISTNRNTSNIPNAVKDPSPPVSKLASSISHKAAAPGVPVSIKYFLIYLKLVYNLP